MVRSGPRSRSAEWSSGSGGGYDGGPPENPPKIAALAGLDGSELTSPDQNKQRTVEGMNGL